MRLLLTLAVALLLCNCTTTSLPTKTALNVESKYRVGPMVQTCGSAQELIPIVEQVWPLVLTELEAEGILKDRAALERELGKSWRQSAARVCLVEQPDLCGPSKPCVGQPICARRRGCAWSWGRYAWVSRHWPPICRPDWPDEPCDDKGTICCVHSEPEQSTDYIPDLIHELAELACQSMNVDAHGAPALAAQARALQSYRKQNAGGTNVDQATSLPSH